MATAKNLPKLAVTIQPLGDRVLVHPVEKETTTASGIVIPDTASGEKPQEGIVITMGKGGIMNDHGVLSPDPGKYIKIGDRVLYGRYAGDDIKLKDTNGKDVEVKVLHLDSILGVIQSA